MAFFVSDDDQIDDVAFQQIIGGFDDAILVALRQHDGLLVRLRLAQQTVLESIGCGRGVEWRFEYRGQFRGVDVVANASSALLMASSSLKSTAGSVHTGTG